MLAKSIRPLMSMPKFLMRLVRSAIFGLLAVFLALMVGMVGYHSLDPMSWPDAFENAAMILSGMGPVTTLTHTSAKIFAGFYALFSGLAFILIMTITLAPLIHRLFHKFHLELYNKDD